MPGLAEEPEDIRLINQILLGDIMPQTVLAQAQALAKADPNRPPPKAPQPTVLTGTARATFRTPHTTWSYLVRICNPRLIY